MGSCIGYETVEQAHVFRGIMHGVTSKVGTVAGFFLSVVVLSGCVPFDPRRPTMDVKVYQNGSTVVFRFQRPGLVTRAVRVRVSIQTAGARRAVVDVWEIVNHGAGRGTTELVYGVTPIGFVSVTPKDGMPPTLQLAEQYDVYAESEDGSRGSSVFIVGPDTKGTPERIDMEK